MKAPKKWLVCLDLTRMDDLLTGYVDFLAKKLPPEEIHFAHVMETARLNTSILDQFPDVNSLDDLQEKLQDHFEDLVEDLFENESITTKVFIQRGQATDQILKLMQNWSYDLLVLGKKNSFIGEGVAARKLVKYVPASILLIPETARYQIEHITVPVDFSEQSANAAKLALVLSEQKPESITLQHIYNHPREFFPYMPSEQEKQKAEKKAVDGATKFIRDFDLSSDFDVELTLQRQERMSDEIYHLGTQKKTDLIVVGYRARKNFMASLKDNLPERMSSYAFGVPLFILKNPKTTMDLFVSLVDS
jgi:nucleotide-binding universal stress UspA family protein